jgi:hypothetical protein
MRVDGPPLSGQIRATRSLSELPKYTDGEERGGCFGLFKRKRGEAAPAAFEKQSIARPPQAGNGPATIKQGGGGVVPGTDAPVSAVNAGDRSVLIECGKSKTIFPVTPTTTALDLIKSAALCMSERIDVKSAVLLEHFGSVGVQRPLRRYEHIRDVMNSWDTDRLNSLLLVDPGTGTSEAELSVAGVPHEKPGDNSWLLSYSQKVGKWDKRLITLKSDGQITLQRDPHKPQHQENICHLDDFDIYTPTQEKLKKKVKPPKKICYAIKSQQKTSIFESTQNFVHFFCTNNRQTADDFYSAVQGWRSWYLVNVMGEGRRPKQVDSEKSSHGTAKGHRQQESSSSQYQLGSFKPLIDMDQFEKQRPASSGSATAPAPMFAKSANQFDTTISPERRTSTNKRTQYPPGAMRNKAQLAEDEPLGNLGKRTSSDHRRTSNGKEEFASTGLLGRSYSQRQREHAERENKRLQPFTNGPNLLNGGYDANQEEYAGRQSLDGPRRNHSTRAKHSHNTTNSSDLRRNASTRRGGSIDLQRSGSKRAPPDMQKPLVDLTPQYREPPQHANKGKGHRPDKPGTLVESATSPEDPLGIPPATDWRGRNVLSSSPATIQQDSRHRARSVSRPAAAATRPTTSRSPADGDGGFTGEGLLATGQNGWGGGNKGRGVADGAHAKGPLLDVNEPSKFAQGSLLNRVEREQGGAGPIIDREKD